MWDVAGVGKMGRASTSHVGMRATVAIPVMDKARVRLCPNPMEHRVEIWTRVAAECVSLMSLAAQTRTPVQPTSIAPVVLAPLVSLRRQAVRATSNAAAVRASKTLSARDKAGPTNCSTIGIRNDPGEIPGRLLAGKRGLIVRLAARPQAVSRTNLPG